MSDILQELFNFGGIDPATGIRYDGVDRSKASLPADRMAFALWVNHVQHKCLLECGGDVGAAMQAAQYIVATTAPPDNAAEMLLVDPTTPIEVTLATEKETKTEKREIHNSRAFAVLTRSLSALKEITTDAKRELAQALKKHGEDGGQAILSFVDKYRVMLARLLTATQLAAMVEGMREVSVGIPTAAVFPGAVPPPPSLDLEDAAEIVEELADMDAFERASVLYDMPSDHQVYLTQALAAHDAGAVQSPQSFALVEPEEGDPEAVHFDTIEEAVRELAGKNVVTREQFDQMNAAARAKAFAVAGADAEDTLLKIRDVLAKNVAQGADYATFKSEVLDAVDEGTFLSEAHLETVFRTNVQGAFSDGQAAILSHPVVRSGFPYSSYDAIHDDRTRPDHLAMEKYGIQGTNVYRNDDPVFQLFRPPWDYNDRCSWTPMTVRQAAEAGIDEAQRWLDSGTEPYPPTHVNMPPFSPSPGFMRSAGDVPRAVALSMQSAGTALGPIMPNTPISQKRKFDRRIQLISEILVMLFGDKAETVARQMAAKGMGVALSAEPAIGTKKYSIDSPGEGWVKAPPGPHGGSIWVYQGVPGGAQPAPTPAPTGQSAPAPTAPTTGKGAYVDKHKLRKMAADKAYNEVMPILTAGGQLTDEQKLGLPKHLSVMTMAQLKALHAALGGTEKIVGTQRQPWVHAIKGILTGKPVAPKAKAKSAAPPPPPTPAPAPAPAPTVSTPAPTYSGYPVNTVQDLHNNLKHILSSTGSLEDMKDAIEEFINYGGHWGGAGASNAISELNDAGDMSDDEAIQLVNHAKKTYEKKNTTAAPTVTFSEVTYNEFIQKYQSLGTFNAADYIADKVNVGVMKQQGVEDLLKKAVEEYYMPPVMAGNIKEMVKSKTAGSTPAPAPTAPTAATPTAAPATSAFKYPAGYTPPTPNYNKPNPAFTEAARPELTVDEAKALTWYTGSSYSDINKPLFDASVKMTPLAEDMHKLLQSAFAKGTEFENPVAVKRGLSLAGDDLTNFVNAMQTAHDTGVLVQMPGYQSTDTAKEFSGNVKLFIAAWSGLDAKPYTKHVGTESELLMNHNLHYRVKSIKKEAAGYYGGDSYKIELEQVYSPTTEQAGAAQTTTKKGPPPPKAAVGPHILPSTPDKVKVIGHLGGSTGAKLVQDDNGHKFVQKKGANEGHLREEAAADSAYTALGIAVPEHKVYDTPSGPVKIAKLVKGTPLNQYLNAVSTAKKDAIKKELQKGFVADALLGNWDVIGLQSDNILVDAQGKPHRIDNGGSLRYRAQGKLKSPGHFGDEVTEIDSMRNPSINPSAAAMFQGITDAEIKAQVNDINSKGQALLAALPPEVRETVKKRLHWLMSKYGT